MDRRIASTMADDSDSVLSELGISPVLDSCSVRSLEGISPVVTTELDVCGAGTPVVGISPAVDVPESTHARTTANANRLIPSVSPLS